jgi:alpha-ketoglutarate-dependent taurine dioxygenase
MTMAARSKLKVRDLEPLIASEISAPKEALLSGEHAEEIKDLLERRGVLVFPKVHFTDQEQMTFTSTLGTLVREARGGDIYKVSLDESQNSTAEYLKGAFFWHMDGMATKVPIRASILSAKVLSPTGGDTQFCNTYAAYEALPDDQKQALEGLKAVHALISSQLDLDPETTLAKFLEWKAGGRQDVPVVWTHKSGRKSLAIGNTAHHIVGMDPLEGAELWIRLRDWATQPQFTYTHKWSVGDVVMWDNTGTLHRATRYPLDSGRMMHRTKLQGEEPLT